MKHPQPIQLTIPNPCHEDWAQMTPDERGRFCKHCQKSVVDFTGWTDRQIHQYITAHEGERVCGRFHASQLNKDMYNHMPPQHTALYKYAAGLGLTLVFSQLPNITVQAQKAYSPVVYNYWQVADTSGCSGVITDDTTHAPLVMANIIVKQGSIEQAHTQTDINGRYLVTPLKPGRYDIQVCLDGYDTLLVKDAIISPQRTLKYDLQLIKADNEQTKRVIAFRVPLIDPFEHNKILTKKEIEAMPVMYTGMVSISPSYHAHKGIVTKRKINGEWVDVPRPNFFVRLWIRATQLLGLPHPQLKNQKTSGTSYLIDNVTIHSNCGSRSK